VLATGYARNSSGWHTGALLLCLGREAATLVHEQQLKPAVRPGVCA
jgi:hypothetical protein